MPFRIDNQTVSDIQLFSNSKGDRSLFEVYDRTSTNGGQALLYRLMEVPFSDGEYLENRKTEIKFFLNLGYAFKLNKRQLDFIEYYLKSKRDPLRNNIIDALRDNIADRLQSSNDYYIIREGIINVLRVLKDLKQFLLSIQDLGTPETLKESFDVALDFVYHPKLSKLLDNTPDHYTRLKYKHVNLFDNLFRQKMAKELRTILDTIYLIDLLQSHCVLLKEEHFCLPEYTDSKDPVFQTEDCFHPLLNDPRSNCISLNGEQSLCFVTGANMSGKSTFLKTIAVLTYFSHLGFPVPAKKLKISVFDGLFTTINLPDNINQGLSHFFAEVSRVKKMALALQENSNMVVILDELFRGTNVKDAFDGTFLVINSLSKIRGVFVFVSTHILEVAEQLRSSDRIIFTCFASTLNIDRPIYDYKLKEGISSERVGLQLIKSEKIDKIFDDIIKRQN